MGRFSNDKEYVAGLNTDFSGIVGNEDDDEYRERKEHHYQSRKTVKTKKFTSNVQCRTNVGRVQIQQVQVLILLRVLVRKRFVHTYK